jgi:BMFP domain-containing protein YqiC
MSFAEPELDDALEREHSDKQSMLASGVALLVLVFAIILVDAKWFSSALMVFFAGAGLVLAIWGAAFLLVLRRGSNWMALASFMALLVVGLGGMTWKYLDEWRGSTQESGRSRYKLMDTLYSSPGKFDVVADSGGGSLTIIGRYLNKILADRNTYHNRFTELGSVTLLEVPQFSGSEQLSNCNGFAKLKEISATAKTNAHVHAKAARAEIEKADLGRRQQEDLLAEFDVVQKIYLPMQDRLWDVRAELADGIAKRCTILARRRWSNNGSGVLFDNEGDYKAYGASSDKLGTLLKEEFEVQDAALRKTVNELNAL